MTDEIDYQTEYNTLKAEVDALTGKLNEYIDANTKLKADLKVAQLVNARTLGTSSEPPKDATVNKVSLADRKSLYLQNLKEKA